MWLWARGLCEVLEAVLLGGVGCLLLSVGSEQQLVALLAQLAMVG